MSTEQGRSSKQGAGKFTIRSLIWSVYAPSFLLSFGQGLLIPVLPVFARDEFGADAVIIGIVVASRSLGTMGFDVPAGMFVGRFGLKRTMLAGVILFGIAAAIGGISPNLVTLIGGRLLAGVSFALWSISRHVYIAQTVPVASRGKALSLFGGISRIATILGPLAGGLLAFHINQRVPFFAQAVVAGVTTIMVLYTFRGAIENATHRAGHNILPVLGKTLVDNQRIFLTAGLASIILQFLRAAREYIIPVWGDDIGLDEAEIGYVTTASFAIDSTMFPIVGYVMDRWGRKFTGVPAYLTMAASLALVPLVDGLPMLMLVGALAGLGNGLSSGFVLTLGSDFAPRDNPGEFLGVWRFISDGGGAGGPLVIGAVAGAFSLGVAAVATAGLGCIGAIVVVALVRETLIKRPEEREKAVP
jgi:MFS family permease